MSDSELKNSLESGTNRVRVLVERCRTDISKRSVSFEVGFRHFSEMLMVALEEMDRKIVELDKRSNKG